MKPSTCALYPLGRATNMAVSENGDFILAEKETATYLWQPHQCGNTPITVRDHLNQFNLLGESEEAAIVWGELMGKLQVPAKEVRDLT